MHAHTMQDKAALRQLAETQVSAQCAACAHMYVTSVHRQEHENVVEMLQHELASERVRAAALTEHSELKLSAGAQQQQSVDEHQQSEILNGNVEQLRANIRQLEAENADLVSKLEETFKTRQMVQASFMKQVEKCHFDLLRYAVTSML